jgi:tellurite resistance protein TehA-like permease
MSPEHTDFPGLWQSQPVEPLRLSPAELRARAGKLQRKIRGRNISEYLAAAFVICVFGQHMLIAESLLSRLGAGLIILGTAFVVYRLHTRGSARRPPPAAMADSCLAFHRRELQRQHDLVDSVATWYLLPFAPGMAVVMGEAASRAQTVGHLLFILGFTAACALIALVVWKLNKMAARKLAEELRALEKTSDS